MPELRNLWERLRPYRATREPRRLWRGFAEWYTVLELVFIVAIAIYVCVAALLSR